MSTTVDQIDQEDPSDSYPCFPWYLIMAWRVLLSAKADNHCALGNRGAISKPYPLLQFIALIMQHFKHLVA